MNGMKLEHLQELEEAMNLHLDIVFYLDGTMYNISWRDLCKHGSAHPGQVIGQTVAGHGY